MEPVNYYTNYVLGIRKGMIQYYMGFNSDNPAEALKNADNAWREWKNQSKRLIRRVVFMNEAFAEGHTGEELLLETEKRWKEWCDANPAWGKHLKKETTSRYYACNQTNP